jgi:hypothetical protein
VNKKLGPPNENAGHCHSYKHMVCQQGKAQKEHT